ncbi:MAG: hypothetical protein J7K73_03045 [Nanoarchaeota archaeon]|nr:hypothetical protein [Nanoarchaeota archaeon]
MNKSVWILVGILIVALAVFFYPKDAGYVVGGLIASDYNVTVMVKYDCYGFFTVEKSRIPCADCGIHYKCYGLLGEKHCFNPEGNEIQCRNH